MLLRRRHRVRQLQPAAAVEVVYRPLLVQVDRVRERQQGLLPVVILLPPERCRT
jgi:hypothetical protein